MLKLSENPPIIWPEEVSIADFEGNWWVAHTKSRNEKALAWQLVNSHVPYFLPMHWKVSKSRGRTIRSLLPLFPGYLFFCGGEDQRLDVLKTNRAAGLIPVEDQKQLVRELLPIETMLKLGNPKKSPICNGRSKRRSSVLPLMNRPKGTFRLPKWSSKRPKDWWNTKRMWLFS